MHRKSSAIHSSEGSDSEVEQGNKSQSKLKGPRARVQPLPASKKSDDSDGYSKPQGKQPGSMKTKMRKIDFS